MPRTDPPIGTTRSGHDGAGYDVPAQERAAAIQRAQARRMREPEPPFGSAYSGSETSKGLGRPGPV